MQFPHFSQLLTCHQDLVQLNGTVERLKFGKWPNSVDFFIVGGMCIKE